MTKKEMIRQIEEKGFNIRTTQNIIDGGWFTYVVINDFGRTISNHFIAKTAKEAIRKAYRWACR